ncbi:MAG TPA: aminoacyl--tRNA ligase-related protein [Bryobacteraceae bacterium]|nr:aminoacyl--tRNA ligase-related protein [Bryobacteraceae bacterium]
MAESAPLPVQIPPELREEFLKKLAYVSESASSYELDHERNQVRFRLATGRESEAALVSERIATVAQKLCSQPTGTSKLLLSRKSEVEPRFTQDPHPPLLESGELISYGQGRWGLGPRMVTLLEYFDRKLTEALRPFGPAPYRFPSLVGAGVMDRCRYIRSFAATLTLTSHVREDLDAIQRFSRGAQWDGERLSYPADSVSGVECLLSSAVCFHYYAALADAKLAEPRTITAVGKCFRYESKNLTGLERLWDFTMREVVFVGAGEWVLAQRQHAVPLVTALLDNWKLSYEIRTATDPFFIEDYASMAAFQLGFDLKYEILATLPYSGKDLAIGSFNYHQDFFGRSFEISHNGAAAHTGCVAFGLERVVLAFLAQHGPDPKAWPALVREETGIC